MQTLEHLAEVMVAGHELADDQGVQRSANISEARATGQNWPYPDMGQILDSPWD